MIQSSCDDDMNRPFTHSLGIGNEHSTVLLSTVKQAPIVRRTESPRGVKDRRGSSGRGHPTMSCELSCLSVTITTRCRGTAVFGIAAWALSCTLNSSPSCSCLPVVGLCRLSSELAAERTCGEPHPPLFRVDGHAGSRHESRRS